MDNQEREARKMAKELPFSEKIKYFFEYYKWHIIIPLVIVLLITLTIVQIVNKEEYDLKLSYYGAHAISEEEEEQINQYLSQHIRDNDGDGKNEIVINTTIISPDATLTDPEYQAGVINKFIVELSAGSNFCYVLSEDFYRAATLSEVEFAKCIDVRENEILSPIFCKTNTPVYLCVREIYDRELGDAEKINEYDNALLLLDKIIQE